MPNEVFIEKSSGVEPWSEDHAAGTMILAGVDSETVLRTVKLARSLFRELGITRITSPQWTLLSEELRRNNIAMAATMLTAFSTGSSPLFFCSPRRHRSARHSLASSLWGRD
jgi:hypothetical protein